MNTQVFLIVAFLIFLISCYTGLRHLFRAAVWDAVPLTLCLSLLLTYLVCVLSAQRFLAAGFLVCGLLFSAVLLCRRRRGARKERVLGAEDLTALLCTGVFFLAAWLMYRHFRVLYDAEFRYYVIAPKWFYETDSLGNNATIPFSGFGSYTPLQGILVYLTMKLAGAWIEPLIYIVNSFACMLLCMPFLKGGMDRGAEQDRGKSFAKLLIGMAVVILFPLLLLHEQFFMLTPESLAGLLFGYGLYAVLDGEAAPGFSYFRIAVILSALVLMKEITVLMVGVCLALLLLLRKKTLRKELPGIAAAAGVILAVRGSWFVYCQVNDLSAYLHWGLGEASAEELNTNADVLTGLLKTFCFRPLNGGTIGLSCLGVLILGGLVLFLLRRREGKKKKSLVLVFAVGFAVYFLCVAYLYVFVLSESEKRVFDAAIRYWGAYAPGLPYVLIVELLSLEGLRAAVCTLAGVTVFTSWGNMNTWFVREHYEQRLQSAIARSEEVRQALAMPGRAWREGEDLCVRFAGKMNFLIKLNFQYQIIPGRAGFEQVESPEDLDDGNWDAFDFSYYDAYLLLRMSEDGKRIESSEFKSGG